MDKLTKRLQTGLLENSAVQIKESTSWYLPVLSVDVTYKRVRRAKMDILMKMMMLTFAEADIRRAANLSEMLLVEELFIADLMRKMERTGLVSIDKGIYRLTGKGQEQLETGIVEEELDEEQTELFYSPTHDVYWSERTVSDKGEEEKLGEFQYSNHQNEPDTEGLLQVLSESKDGLDEDGFQTVVDQIVSFEQHVVEVPCVEFILYNKEQDLFYSRIWNTMLEQWDEKLEKQVEERERVKWREEWAGDLDGEEV